MSEWANNNHLGNFPVTDHISKSILAVFHVAASPLLSTQFLFPCSVVDMLLSFLPRKY
jgi:hypothetical protein